MDIDVNVEAISQLVNDQELVKFVFDRYDFVTVAWLVDVLCKT